MKREEAELRLTEYRSLSVSDKIAKLDKKFGKGLGAKKQRARLAKELVKEGM